jgi:hypothetical protein
LSQRPKYKRRLQPCQRQVSEHFAPTWGVDATLNLVVAGAKPLPGSWWLVILDDSDQAGTLGYHDLTDEAMPLGKVFVKTAQAAGIKWTVTASHELLELLADRQSTSPCARREQQSRSLCV